MLTLDCPFSRDQFCSLVFTLQNFFFIGCIYVDGFSPNWRHQCGLASKYWPAPFVLAILPFVLRLVQSVKRWYDSGLVTHLINVRCMIDWLRLADN